MQLTHSGDHTIVFFVCSTASEKADNGYHNTDDDQEDGCSGYVAVTDLDEVSIVDLDECTNDDQCNTTDLRNREQQISLDHRFEFSVVPWVE